MGRAKSTFVNIRSKPRTARAMEFSNELGVSPRPIDTPKCKCHLYIRAPFLGIISVNRRSWPGMQFFYRIRGKPPNTPRWSNGLRIKGFSPVLGSPFRSLLGTGYRPLHGIRFRKGVFHFPCFTVLFAFGGRAPSSHEGSRG
jgi:hypothetical protein